MKLVDKALELAQQQRIKQGELARMIGVDPSRITEWKKDDGKPSVEQAFRMARALGVSLDFLADDSLDEPPSELQLAHDEELALDAYRDLREQLGRHEALKAVMRLTAAPEITHTIVDPRKQKRAT